MLRINDELVQLSVFPDGRDGVDIADILLIRNRRKKDN